MKGLIIGIEGEIDMNKKKIIIYAGVLIVVAAFVLVGSAGSIEKASSDGGCNRIYDVNRDEIINFQDAGLCWVYVTSPEIHNEFGDLLYDVNCDHQVNFQDCGLIWVNRD